MKIQCLLSVHKDGHRAVEVLYQNVGYLVRVLEAIVRRGLPIDAWPFLPCVLYLRVLLINIRQFDQVFSQDWPQCKWWRNGWKDRVERIGRR